MSALAEVLKIFNTIPTPFLVFGGIFLVVSCYNLISRFSTAMIASACLTIGYYVVFQKKDVDNFSTASLKDYQKWQIYQTMRSQMDNFFKIAIPQLQNWIKLLRYY